MKKYMDDEILIEDDMIKKVKEISLDDVIFVHEISEGNDLSLFIKEISRIKQNKQ